MVYKASAQNQHLMQLLQANDVQAGICVGGVVVVYCYELGLAFQAILPKS